MSRHILTRDGAVVYDFTDGGVTQPPIETPQPPQPTPPSTPPVTPPSGAFTIVPSWGPWDARYPGTGFPFSPGMIYAFPVPTEPPGGASFTIGQTPSQAAHFGFEFCLSLSPGVIDPASRDYINWPIFSNNFLQKIYAKDDPYNYADAFKAYPGGPWYWNVRLKGTPTPSTNSVQWTY